MTMTNVVIQSIGQPKQYLSCFVSEEHFSTVYQALASSYAHLLDDDRGWTVVTSETGRRHMYTPARLLQNAFARKADKFGDLLWGYGCFPMFDQGDDFVLQITDRG